MTSHATRLRRVWGDIAGLEVMSMGNYDKSQVETIRLEAMATLREEARVERGLENIVSQCERLERRIATRQTTPRTSVPEVA